MQDIRAAGIDHEMAYAMRTKTNKTIKRSLTRIQDLTQTTRITPSTIKRQDGKQELAERAVGKHGGELQINLSENGRTYQRRFDTEALMGHTPNDRN